MSKVYEEYCKYFKNGLWFWEFREFLEFQFPICLIYVRNLETLPGPTSELRYSQSFTWSQITEMESNLIYVMSVT